MANTNDPMALQIKLEVEKILRDAKVMPEDAIVGDQARPKPVEMLARVNVLFIDDAIESDLSSFDAEGRALELDFMIEVNKYKRAEDHLKRVSGFIEAALMANNGFLRILGGVVRAERAGDSEPTTSNDGEYDVASMTSAYSFIYRVRRGNPYELA